MLTHSFLLSLAHCLISYGSAILASSVNLFSQHPCPWTLVGEECTNSYEVPSPEHGLRSCKQEVSVLLFCAWGKSGLHLKIPQKERQA